MNATFRDFTTNDAVACAAASLSRAAGEPVTISDISVLGDERRRNHVIRAVAQAGSGNRQGIVIKATRAADYNASSEDTVAKGGIGREWAAASVLDPESAGTARFLAGDVAAGVVVFADLGAEAPWLATPLRQGSASEAEAALLAYAISLGRLHATTVGCQQAYAAGVQAAYPRARVPRSVGEAWLAGAAAIGPSRLGGVLPEAELALLRQRMRDPGPWLALVHGDACPDNVLLTEQGAALLDFEFAAPVHALFDAAYWRMGFPTCWCAGRVPDPVAERVEQAYRDTVADAIPAAQNIAEFRLEYAAAVVVRLFGSLEWHLDAALKEDSTWGIATLRNRILWHVKSAIEAMERADVLPGTCRTARAWLSDLRQRRPDVQALPAYPAFAASAAG